MRVKQSIVIPVDEIKVSKIDLVARARRQIIDDLGDNLISASPSLIHENDGTNNIIIVGLEMDVYDSHDFDQRIKYLKMRLSDDDFKIVFDTLSVNIFPLNIDEGKQQQRITNG